jgi:TatA/E family protein of Tat protein translocase
MEIPVNFILLFGISGGEIFIILLLVLLLFGPKKIPEIARTIGKGINEVKKVQRDINAEINRYADEIEKPVKQVENDLDKFKDNYYNPDEGYVPPYAQPKTNAGEEQEETTAVESSDYSEQKSTDDLPYPYNQQENVNADLEKEPEKDKNQS